jgi:hypothetical protein
MHFEHTLIGGLLDNPHIQHWLHGLMPALFGDSHAPDAHGVGDVVLASAGPSAPLSVHDAAEAVKAEAPVKDMPPDQIWNIDDVKQYVKNLDADIQKMTDSITKLHDALPKTSSNPLLNQKIQELITLKEKLIAEQNSLRSTPIPSFFIDRMILISKETGDTRILEGKAAVLAGQIETLTTTSTGV